MTRSQLFALCHSIDVLEPLDSEIQLTVNKKFCWLSQRHLGPRVVIYSWRKNTENMIIPLCIV